MASTFNETDLADLMGDEEIIDFSEIKAPEPIPEAWYAINIAKAEAKKSKAGHWKISCRLKVEAGEHEGRTFFEDVSLAPAAISYSKATMTGMGLDSSFRGTPRDMAEALEGLSFYGRVKIDRSEQYGDRNRLRTASQDRPAELDDLF